MARTLRPVQPCDHLGPDWRIRSGCDHIASVEIKIGISRGVFLCDLAERYPRSFLVGVEINRASAEIAYDRLSSYGLSNVRVVNAEALTFLQQSVPDATIDVVHVYHPTPYPGALGLRQRLVTAAFECEVFRILKPWGTLRFATDHRGYFYRAAAMFPASRWWNIPWQLQPIALERGCVVGSPLEQQHRSDGTFEVFTAQLLSIPSRGAPASSLV